MKPRRLLILLLVLALALLASTAGSLSVSEGAAAIASPAISAATCTASEKATRQAAVVAYQKQTYNEAQIPGVYSLFHVAVDHLVSVAPGGLSALTAYYNALGSGMSWPQAFQSSFGLSVDAYYANFNAYRAGL